MVASVIGALRVNLGLDSAQFSRGLGQSSSKLSQFAASAGKIAAGLVASMGAAMTAMGVGAVQAGAEIERLSQVANTMPDQFQRWSAGAKSVGIEQDKLADILKDVNDRVGDFVQTGGGPMADFFEKIGPKVGVTAKHFRGLSGADALQLYVSSLQKANVNQQDFTFYMEAMASDSTLLLPLLKDAGALMTEYGDRAQRMGAIMSGPMLASLKEGRVAISDMRMAVEGMKNTIGAQAVPVIKVLAAAVAAAATFFHQHAAAISEGLRTLAGIVIVIAAAFTTKYVVAIGVSAVRAMVAFVTQSIALEMALGAQSRAAALASVAVKGLSVAFGFLRAAIISTGIGVLVVAAGYLVGKLIDLISKVGGVGNAFRLLKDVAVEIFDRIGIAFDIVPAAVSAGVQSMKSVFLGGLHDMLANFAWFISSIARGMNAVLGTSLSEAEPFQETISALSDAASSASDAAASAGARMKAAWQQASAPLQSLAALNREVAANAGDAAGALGGDTSGGGVAGAAEKAGKAGSEAAKKLTPLQEVLKSLREEASKLKATLWMGETDAAIWDNLDKAKVSANSASGKEITALTRQIEGMKQLKSATEEWRDTVKSAFTDFVAKGASFRDSLSNIIAKLAEMVASVGFDTIWKGIGGDAMSGGFLSWLGIGANASGTPNWRGGLSRINERGAEIIDLPKGSRVFPHEMSKRMVDQAANGGGGVVRVELVPNDQFDAHVTGLAGNVVAQAAPSIQRGAVSQMAKANRKTKSVLG